MSILIWILEAILLGGFSIGMLGLAISELLDLWYWNFITQL